MLVPALGDPLVKNDEQLFGKCSAERTIQNPIL